MIPGQHALIQRHAVQAGCDRGLGNSLGGGFGLEIVEPCLKVAGAAGTAASAGAAGIIRTALTANSSEKKTRGHRESAPK